MPYIVKYEYPGDPVRYLHILKDGTPSFYAKSSRVIGRFLLTKSEVDDIIVEDKLTDQPFITVEYIAPEVEEYEPKERVICHI